MELTQIWIGRFAKDAPADYFTEVYSEDDDQPISRFVGEQGEVWVDHDWMETYWNDVFVSTEDLIQDLSPGCKESVLNEVQKLKINEANVLVTISNEDDIKKPRSVQKDKYTLYYIGTFDNTYESPTIEEWILKAEGGCSKSQAALGGLYIFPPPGEGYVIDYQKAEYWLLKATEQGETSPYNRLFHLYYKDSEEHHDLDKAFYWIEKAAQVGWMADQRYCAMMYENGEGVVQNNVQAMKWNFLCSCQTSSDSKDESIEKLKRLMTEEEIQKAEKEALAWIEARQYDPERFLGFNRNPLA